MPINISHFYSNECCDYASYDNYRKIGSICDGLKPSSRKCLYTILSNNITSPKKVSVLKSDVASKTQYLHGDQSLEGVLVGMAQDFVGTNNIPYLKREGTFGNRLIPEAAAGRYIFTCKEDYLDKIYRKDDTPILIEQIFEGDVIEPKFYVPIIPMLVINGSVGLTTGFTQKILQHNPKDVIKYIRAKLDGKTTLPKIIPWFNGFTGDVVENSGKGDGSWLIKGKYKKISNNEIEITEIPPSYTLEKYVEVLDDLEETHSIKEYKDYSESGKFRFVVKFYRNDQGFDIDDKNLLSKLKLIEAETENYTSFDENNKVVEYSSIYEIIDHYYDVRLEYYDKRKQWLINDITNKLREAVSKYVFIDGVVSGKIVIAKKSDEEIENQLSKISMVVKVDDSYNYLVNMPIRSMTKDNMEKLKEAAKNLKTQLDEIKASSAVDLWKKDLDELEKVFK